MHTVSDGSRFIPGAWIASSGVLASLLIISWIIFIVTCVVAVCVYKRSKGDSEYVLPFQGINVLGMLVLRIYVYIQLCMLKCTT